MDPKLPNEEIFQKFLYAYLKEKGYVKTAEVFRTETQNTQPMSHGPPGFLYQFWNSFYHSRDRLQLEEYFRQQVMVPQPSNSSTQSQVLVHQQPSNSSTQSQVLVQPPLGIGPLMDTATAQRIWEQTWEEFRILHQPRADVNVGQREIEIPKRFDLSPSMEDLLKRSVTMFTAGFRTTTKLQLQAKASLPGRSAMSSLDSPVVSGADVAVDPCGHSRFPDNQAAVNSVLSKFHDLNLDENLEIAAEDLNDEVIRSRLDQIKDLEKQVKERKEWALKKALEAAKRLSDDMIELKTLRMEREDNQNLEKMKQTVESIAMIKLSEMANALREASGEMDCVMEEVRRLETENAEISAEIEASKLNASESETAYLEVAKKEKKWSKKLRAWEKQKAKLQEEVSKIKEKISEALEVSGQTSQRQQEAEVKWKEELKAQEDALALVEEEHRAKETAESNNKRKLEALRLKMNIDCQRHKDDLRRLEQDLSRLRASVGSAVLHHQLNASSLVSDFEGPKPQRESTAKLLLDNQDDLSEKEANNNRECFICMKDEVSVVFLPCAHQVMCAKCSDEYGKEGKASCPFCGVQIQQRIHVFGASS